MCLKLKYLWFFQRKGPTIKRRNDIKPAQNWRKTALKSESSWKCFSLLWKWKWKLCCHWSAHRVWRGVGHCVLCGVTRFMRIHCLLTLCTTHAQFCVQYNNYSSLIQGGEQVLDIGDLSPHFFYTTIQQNILYFVLFKRLFKIFTTYS